MRVLQLVPSLHVGGVERGVVEVDDGLVRRGHASFVASAGGPMCALLGGVHLQSASLRRRDPWSVLVWNPILLSCWMRRHGVRLVHARSRCLVASALIACALTPGSRVVATWHGVYSWHGRCRRAFNGLLLRAHRLILPSEYVRRHLEARYALPSSDDQWVRHQVHVVHRGVLHR